MGPFFVTNIALLSLYKLFCHKKGVQVKIIFRSGRAGIPLPVQNRKNAIMKTIDIRLDKDFRIPSYVQVEGNDYAIIRLTSDTMSGLGLRELRKALAEAISGIEAEGVTPVLLSLPPLELRRWLDGCNAYLWHEAVNMELCRLAWQNGIPFIDITTPMLGEGKLRKLLKEDGLQLSREGESFVNSLIDKELALI